MSEQHGIYVSSFGIEHGVMNLTKNNELRFIKGLPKYAATRGMTVKADLGMPAIEVARRGEMWGLLEDNPEVNFEDVTEVLDIYKKGKFPNISDYRYEVELGVPKVYCPVNELSWIGAEVLGEKDEFRRDRNVVAEVLGEITGRDIKLEPIEMFMNVGVIDTNSGGVDDVLDWVDDMLPETVDVYDIYVRKGNLYIP